MSSEVCARDLTFTHGTVSQTCQSYPGLAPAPWGYSDSCTFSLLFKAFPNSGTTGLFSYFPDVFSTYLKIYLL